MYKYLHLFIIIWTICSAFNLFTARRHSVLLTLTRIIFAPFIALFKTFEYLFLKP
jgi:hypothetical protein